jgi:hypothetical protein
VGDESRLRGLKGRVVGGWLLVVGLELETKNQEPKTDRSSLVFDNFIGRGKKRANAEGKPSCIGCEEYCGSSYEGHMVDALAPAGEEGRG